MIRRRSSKSPGEVAISNPGKIYLPDNGITKADVVRYYLAVADGALGGVAGGPMVLKRYVHGAAGEAFFQTRAPSSRPAWIETVERRAPGLATSRWWKEEQHGVFVDYNQNAKDRTVTSPTRSGRYRWHGSRRH